ncbi:DMT family transporter [Desulfolutivibrio sp.]|uniref:DMT family transporter n=1 Tax=Desulfolutivibrio sp. TaxID=2773296 RepID=UPI002F96DEE8
MAAGYAYVLCAAVLWGLIGPASKLAFEAGMAPLEVAFWRTALAWALFGTHALISKDLRLNKKDILPVAAFGICGIAGLFGSYVYAVKLGGAAMASVLLYTAPAWVALMSFLLLKERMGPFKIAAVAATILGVAGISLGPRLAGDVAGSVPVTVASVLVGLLAGFTYALYFIFGKLYLSRYKTPTIFFYALPIGALALLPFFDLRLPSLSGLAACAFLALCSTYGAYSVYYAGLRHLEATRAAVVATIEPVVAAGLAWIMFGEVFTPVGYGGSALILLGVLLAIWEGGRQAVRVPKSFLPKKT